SATTTTADDLTLAQTLIEIRSTRPKAKGIVFKEPSKSTTTTRPQQQPLKDKGKGLMVEPEKPTKRKEQIRLDKEAAQRLQAELQAELEEKERLVDDVQETAEVDGDQERAKIKKHMEIVSDEEEVAIDAIPLATNPPSIIDWKIHTEGKKSYYQIISANGKSQKLVEDLDLILWGDLKTMFKPSVEDKVWRNKEGYKVLNWKLYDSCGVHSLEMQHMHIYMLVEKKYHPTPATIIDMLNKKLQLDHFSEMAY
ncbi:hypothetical protein Tco_1382831, partial [Tanacetum coccineum]